MKQIIIQYFFPKSYETYTDEEKKSLYKAFAGNTVVVFIGIVMLFVFKYLGYNQFIAPNIIGIVLVILGLVFIRFGKIDLSIVYVTLSTSGGFLFMFIKYPLSHFQWFYIPIAIVCLTDITHVRLGKVSFVLYVLLFFVLTFLRYPLAGVSYSELNTTDFLYLINTVTCSVIVLFAVINYKINEGGFIKKVVKQNEIINQQKNEIQKQSHVILMNQRKEFDIEFEKANQDIETLKAGVFYRKSIREKIIDELEGIQKSDDTVVQLKALIRELKINAKKESQLDFIQQNVGGDLDAVFFDVLAKKHPNLSKTEREICSLIKLNISTKEIAELRNTSVNTIYVTQNRIRKKMGLDNGASILKALQTLQEG